MLSCDDMGVEGSRTLPLSDETSDPCLASGARCGEWRLRSVLASGGFGRVFSAQHGETGQEAAVKVLRAELSQDADAVARFEREATLLRELAIPGLVKLYDLGKIVDGRPFMVMELLSGHDLKAWLKLRGRMPPDHALSVMKPLCETLGHAHAAGVVHRDVKASNVHVAFDAETPRRVTILDFGLAKLLDPAAAGLTASRQILGTPASMAPEQIIGSNVDARTDIYALGALAFELLAGEPPFVADSVHMLCQMHLHARAPSVSARAPVSRAFDEVLARALSKDRAHRYESCAQFFAALRAAADSASGEARQVPCAEAGIVVVAVQVTTGLQLVADAELRRDFDAVLPLARSQLEAEGLIVLLRAGDLLLTFRELPPDPEAALRCRREVLAAARRAAGVLAARAGRRPGIDFGVSVAVGTAELAGSRVSAGRVAEEARAAAALGRNDVVATGRAVDGLDVSGAVALLSGRVRFAAHAA